MNLILRFTFCLIALKFKCANYEQKELFLPKSNPQIQDSVIENETIVDLFQKVLQFD